MTLTGLSPKASSKVTYDSLIIYCMSFVSIRRLNDIKNAPDHRHQAWLQRFNYRHSGPQGGPNNKQTSGEHLETKSFKWCRVAEFLRKKSRKVDDAWWCLILHYMWLWDWKKGDNSSHMCDKWPQSIKWPARGTSANHTFIPTAWYLDPTLCPCMK